MEDYRNMLLVEEGTRKITTGEIGRRQWKFERERKKINVYRTEPFTSLEAQK